MTLDLTRPGSRGRRQGRRWAEAGGKPLSYSQDQRTDWVVCSTAHMSHMHERPELPVHKQRFPGTHPEKAVGSETDVRGFRTFCLKLPDSEVAP